MSAKNYEVEVVKFVGSLQDMSCSSTYLIFWSYLGNQVSVHYFGDIFPIFAILMCL
jgi:hypothetical protein